MGELITSYFSSRLETKPVSDKGHFGVFAREAIPAGELIILWSGRVVEEPEFTQLAPLVISRSVQVDDRLYLVPLQTENSDFVNHSCNPNVGLSGQIGLITMRDIAAGEEICYDYAMSDGSDYDEFECHCGEATCRHTITGNDWMLPELQERYNGYFSPYLQRRIERMKRDVVAGERPA
jgi:uncharacterized protein